jgi:hypothetical protein
MNSDNNAVDREMLLAEFVALRQEIVQRTSLQWNIFALQLTAAGVVYSFALSSPSHTAFLLILPVITYALTGRYVSQYMAVQKVGIYIREVLEVRAKGGLQWESWTRYQPPRVRARALNWLNPLLIAFPGPAIIALASVAPYVWTSQNASVGRRVLLVIIWLVGVVVTALSVQLTTRVISRHWNRSWQQRLKERSGISDMPGNTAPAETLLNQEQAGDPDAPA